MGLSEHPHAVESYGKWYQDDGYLETTRANISKELDFEDDQSSLTVLENRKATSSFRLGPQDDIGLYS